MYIRTKIGIFEKETPNKDNDFLVEDETRILTTGGGLINKKSIINQSDSIEELCDEFVLYDNQLKTYGVFDKKVITFKWLQNHLEIYKGMTIYGAIWTSKGLIYVAKMNENGVLCLI